MTKRTPLHEIEQAHGATFEARAVPGPEGQDIGWEIASSFSTVEDECRAVRNAVGLLDLSHHGKIEITGADRVRYLNGQVTNDVVTLTSEKGCYACALNYKGALVGDMKIYAHPDCFLIDTTETCTYKLLEHFIRFAISDEVEIADKSDDIAHLGLHGPHSSALLSRLIAKDLSELSEFDHVNRAIDGLPVEVIRQGYTGEVGFDLFVPSEDATALWRKIRESGASFGSTLVGFKALDILRLEAGVPVFGVDMTEDHLALEANLMSAISTDKGCYTGQEVVARIINRGHVNRILAGFQIRASKAPLPGERIFKSGKVVGEITSAAFSPALGKVVALGYVPALQAQTGNEFQVGETPESAPAEVVALPFYQRKN